MAPALAFCLAILLCAVASRINIGVRHILPIYVGLAVIGGGVAAAMLQRRVTRWILAGLLLWHVASGALQHPDYLAYTNEIAGSHPENFVADSDLDWGQDMKRLAEPSTTRRRYGSDFRAVQSNLRDALPAMHFRACCRLIRSIPRAGWNAVSVSTWKIFGVPKWANRVRPQERVGRSILLWHFP